MTKNSSGIIERSFNLSGEDIARIMGAEIRQCNKVNFEGDGEEPLYEYVLPNKTVLQEYFDRGLHLALRQVQ